ncbi:hypothetical protein N7492_000805 [Penicillium capsulatum]|uniref:Septin-type G domain-containing protein n=1 Tax=Penicillium capsulatum TaxID=69766 RepID=A0A9W9LZR7_9EURO|nr:hypothetical protein N7492_000805 [Penicillium capsulatum]KAJ6130136.1 hypothetical protein N7512_002916 [Penicillium capsulatum]
MRPTPELPSFSPKPSLDPPPPLHLRTAPATFFLSRNPHAPAPDCVSPPSDLGDSKESMCGVQSLDESLPRSETTTCSPRSYPVDLSVHSPLQGSPDLENQSVRRRSTLRPFDAGIQDSPIHSPLPEITSRPLSPLHPDEPPSLPSSPKSMSNQSLRPFDDVSITDEIGSQAGASGDEDDRPAVSPRLGPSGASQLIMPSIKMPSRRPFTERGKSMGRFKLLLAGATGSGKTSLIKSIVQACEDIVHVDSLPSDTSLERRRLSRPHRGSVPTCIPAVTEIYASTKPYPSWWSDLEDSRVLRRRKSIGEIVLERNLCFVDTPAVSLSRPGQTDAVVQYMRQQVHRTTTALTGPGVDLQNLLAGNGGSQVDAILYLISQDTLPMDVECIRKFCELSNVIPVIAKADTLSPEQILVLKAQFHQQAQEAGIKPFLFGDMSPGGLDALEPQPPYTVSSERTTDMEVMDASTLMSPDYVQPLIASELDILVQKLFDRDNLAWMRHSAAKKLVQRWSHVSSIPASLTPSPPNARLAPSGNGWRAARGVSMASSTSSHGESCTFAMARISDYTRNEENLAQVRLAQWATDLQRSLQNERDRYASLARGDRAVWLTERLSECVVDGSLVPISQTPGFRGLHLSKDSGTMSPHARRHRAGSGTKYRVAHLSLHDPLGVVGWIDDLGRRGWALVQIVGSVGVVGGLALWLARTWGFPTRSLVELHLDYWYGSGDQ